MQIQYCAAVPAQGQAKPSLEIRSLESTELMDVVPGSNGYAVLWRRSIGVGRAANTAPTWEDPSKIWARMASATVGALIVLVSEDDMEAAQANHDT